VQQPVLQLISLMLLSILMLYGTLIVQVLLSVLSIFEI
jgi:hypothetical protein